MTNEFMGMAEIMEVCGMKNRKNFRLNYILPAISDGSIEWKYPDQPKHPHQMYRLTEEACNWKKDVEWPNSNYNTKSKGLEKQKLIQMVLQYLKNAGEEGSKRDSIYEYLKDVLPQNKTREQQLRMLGDLLNSMKDEKLIIAKGRTWYECSL